MPARAHPLPPRTGLLFAALFGLTFSYAIADGTTVTVTQKAPIETVSPTGDVTGVTESTVGAKFIWLSSNGAQLTLKDAQGAKYLIDQGATDYTPPASATAGSPASNQPATTSPAVATTTPSVTPPPARSTPPAAPAASAALNPFLSNLQGHLVTLSDDGQFKDLDATTLQNVKYWAIYFSASWCPDCRAFTPDLVRFYHEFKQDHPNFELILVTADRSEQDMLNYMKNDHMEWPALRYSDKWNRSLRPLDYVTDWIPNLVLVDQDGKVLSRTSTSDSSPARVMDDIRKLVPDPSPSLSGFFDDTRLKCPAQKIITTASQIHATVNASPLAFR